MKFDDYFRPFPVLNTPRLILRSLSHRDIGDVFNYCSREAVSRFVAWSPHKSKNDSRGFIDWVQMNYKTGLSVTWGIELRGTGKLIGTCSYVSIDPFFKVTELGYAISDAYWGFGYGSEAAMALVHFGFRQVGFQRMESRCMPENTASLRVLEKIGMSFEGVLCKGIYCKGAPRDIRLYAITDDVYNRMMT
ncbi:MAG: GNAT family N-acetyltransferase [Oscillospiraceae bacterium]|jgi:ribosomal-protein-alanine N-acetyltransferase|nr:GNAT family N-acetyltransferase [Oscillospiraceae bacterium]